MNMLNIQYNCIKVGLPCYYKMIRVEKCHDFTALWVVLPSYWNLFYANSRTIKLFEY